MVLLITSGVHKRPASPSQIQGKHFSYITIILARSGLVKEDLCKWMKCLILKEGAIGFDS